MALSTAARAGGDDFSKADSALLEGVSRAAFEYFVVEADPVSGLVRDKTGVDVCSIASTGFGLTAMAIGADRGWIAADDARERVLRILRTLERSKAQREGVFCHYLDMRTGGPARRGYEKVTSTIDTALLMAGVITAGQYFGGQCGDIARELFSRVNWRWYLDGDSGQVYMAWEPQVWDELEGPGSFHKARWNWYTDEVLLICMLGTSAPKAQYRLGPECMDKWKRPVGRYKDGPEFVYTWPGTLFTYMFAQCYYDFRVVGRQPWGVDWFENTRRAAAANRDWCRDHADRFASYGRDRWGITACSGPGGRYVVPGCQPRGARGDKPEGGTLAPYGAAMALPYLRDDSMAAIRHMRGFEVAGKPLWKGLDEGGYGFCDAFNADERWVSSRVFGIAAGPMLIMIENARSGFVWRTFMADEDIKAGIKRLTPR